MKKPGHKSHVSGTRRFERNKDLQRRLEEDEKRLQDKYIKHGKKGTQ